MIRKLAAVVGVGLAVVGMSGAPALADHGEAHNGETMELSKTEDLVDGEIITVDLASWTPGSTVTIVECFEFPATGPTSCELSTYGDHTVEIGDDGTGTYEYPVYVVPDKCGPGMPCYIVSADGFGADANFVGIEVTFAEAAPETTVPETTVPETTVPATTVPATTEPAPETTEAAPETTEAAPETTEAAPETTEAATETTAADDEDDDGGSGWVIPVVIIAALALVGGGIYAARKRGGSDTSAT